MTTPKQQIAFPEVAVLRKGTPKVKGGQAGNFIQGKDLGNKFRISFFPGTKDSRDMWQKAHPESYVKYDMTYRLPGVYSEPDGFEIERIRAMVPFRSVFDAWEWSNEAHSAGRMVAKADDDHYLMLRDPLTGKYIVQNGEPYTEFHHGDSVTYEKNGKPMNLPIKTVGRLRLFIPELERMVFITLKTTSYYDRLNIDSQLSAIQFLANTLNNGNAAGIPFYVYRREQEICWNKPDGSAQRIKKWLVNIEADSEWVKAATNRMANFALTGEVMTRALLPAGETIVGGISPDEIDDDAPEAELDNNVIDGVSSDVAETPAPATSVDTDFPPLPADWQAAKAAKEEEKKPADNKPMNGAPRPYSAENLKAAIDKQVARYKGYTASPKQASLAVMLLDIAMMDEGKNARHTLTKYLFGKPSMKDLDGAEVNALIKWLDPQKQDGGDFTPGKHVTQEAKAAYRQALIDEGQQDLFSGGVTLEV
jgi:hypothetical protein